MKVIVIPLMKARTKGAKDKQKRKGRFTLVDSRTGSPAQWMVHHEDCPVVARARTRRHNVADYTEEDEQDLKERGYKVKWCGCTK